MWQFEAIGTHWSIETPDALNDDVKKSITTVIEQFDKTYSRFRDDSLVMQIAKRAGEYDFPKAWDDLIQLYRQLYLATDGAVTPLVGDALTNLGYDKDYTLMQKSAGDVANWDDVMQLRGSRVITSRPVILDFGAAGKGYLVDLVAHILERSGVKEYTIDASGDIRHRGANQQVIGLENPYDASRVIGTMMLQNVSLCASASNRRRWGDGLHHVVDGRTGRPTNEIVATWVHAKTTALADGLATALFFVGADRLDMWDFQYVRLYADGKVEHSKNFVGELFV